MPWLLGLKGLQMRNCWVGFPAAHHEGRVHWGAHLRSVLLQSFLDGGADCRILLAELGRHLGMVRVLHHAQQIMVHQHLPHHRLMVPHKETGDFNAMCDRCFRAAYFAQPNAFTVSAVGGHTGLFTPAHCSGAPHQSRWWGWIVPASVQLPRLAARTPARPQSTPHPASPAEPQMPAFTSLGNPIWKALQSTLAGALLAARQAQLLKLKTSAIYVIALRQCTLMLSVCTPARFLYNMLRVHWYSGN